MPQIDFNLIADLPRQPRPIQKEAVVFLMHTNRSILADGVGLGKTSSALFAYEYYRRLCGNSTKLLFLCKKTALFKIGREVEVTLGREPVIFVPTGSISRKAACLHSWKHDGNDVMIMTHDSFKREYDELLPLICSDRDALVVDEVHRFKTFYPKASANWKYLSNISKYFKILWTLTATAFENSPMEVYGIFSAIDPSYAGSFDWFLETFCNFNTIQDTYYIYGIRNPEYYNYVYRKVLMRASSDEMPKGHIHEIVVDLNPEQIEKYAKIKAQYAELKRYQMTFGTAENNELQVLVDAPALKGLNCGSPKAEALLNFMNNNPDDKFVLYSFFKDILYWYCDFFNTNEIPTRYISGDITSSAERDQIIQEFNKDDGGIRTLLVNSAAADSVDLPAARFLIMINLPYSAIEFEQVKGRIMRLISTFEEVHYFILLAGEVDEDHWAILNKKGDQSRKTKEQSHLVWKNLQERA